MASVVARLEAILSADTDKFDRAMDGAEKSMSKIGGVAGTAFKAVGAAALAGGAAVGVGLKKSVDAASNLGESMNAVSVVFGSSSKIITDFGKNAAEKTGLSMRSLNELVTPIGASLINMGDSADIAATKSVALAQRAADMASVFNVDVADALGAIQAGLRGEADPLERFGVGLSDAAVKAQAMSMGLAETEKALTAADKAQARYALLMEQTSRVQGDFANTSGGVANSQRIVKAELENAAAAIGTALLPSIAKVTSAAADLIPKLVEWAGVLMDRLRPAFQAVVSWVQDNWPRISIIAGGVFTAFSAAWSQALKPALDALLNVAKSVVTWIIDNWPQISAVSRKVFDTVREIVEGLVGWFNANLKPTIASVAGNVREHWGTIESVTRKVWGALEGIIRPLLEAVKAAINTILAVIRGDWQTAWDNLKKIPGAILRAIVASVESFAGLFKAAAKALGSAIIDGLKAGIEAGADLVKQAIEWLADQIPGWAKKVLQIESPSKVMAAIGRSIVDGLSVGVLEQKLKLANALKDVLDAAVDRARDRVSRVGSDLAGVLSNAFSAKQRSVRTKTEKVLDEYREMQATKALNDEKLAAEEELTRAMASEAEDRASLILAAQKRLQDANTAILVAGLEKQAAAERQELEGRQAFEQINFNNRLAALQGYLASGEATASGATARIKEFMSDFGISMGAIGELLGDNYATGIRNMIPTAVAAATALAKAVEEALKGAAVVTKIEKALTVAEKAEEALGKRSQAMNKRYGLGDAGAGSSSGGAAGGGINLMGARPEMMPFAVAAQGLGLNVSSGLRPGAVTKNGTPSDHATGKALDLVGSASAMAGFFRSLVGNPRVKQAFYDPLGSIFGGALSSYREGGHSDHVHVATYDKGGWLAPHSKTLAINNTPHWEPVGPPGASPGDVHIHLNGDVYGDVPRSVAKRFYDALRQIDREQTGGRILSSAPTLT